jgi:hypothetical protein
MEAARTSETSVDNYFTRQYIPEDNSEHHTRRREKLKSSGWWRQHVPLKRRSTIILHGSTSQKTILNFILATLRTWNLTCNSVLLFLSSFHLCFRPVASDSRSVQASGRRVRCESSWVSRSDGGITLLSTANSTPFAATLNYMPAWASLRNDAGHISGSAIGRNSPRVTSSY